MTFYWCTHSVSQFSNIIQNQDFKSSSDFVAVFDNTEPKIYSASVITIIMHFVVMWKREGKNAFKVGRKGPGSGDRGSRPHKFVLIASDVTFCFNYAVLSGR